MPTHPTDMDDGFDGTLNDAVRVGLRSARTLDRPLRVLIIEDSENDALLIERALAAGGFTVVARRVETETGLETAMQQGTWDVLISDCAIPGFSAEAALHVHHRRRSAAPFVIVSGTIGEEAAAALMKAGAHDYVSKGNLARLSAVVTRELQDAEVRVAHRAVAERLRYLAFHDPVTELPNRAMLFQLIDTHSRQRSRHLAVLCVELLGLADARKTLGAIEVDGLLRIAARRFAVVVGTSGTVAYLGSDRFGIVLPDAGDVQAETMAAACADALLDPLIASSCQVRASMYVGIALAPGHGQTAAGLLRRSEIAAECALRQNLPMYVYSPDLDIYTRHRLDLVGALWQAANRGELELHYQPKADLRDGSVRTVEALVRWNRPGHGTLMPDEFIPLAENSGSIRQVTAWVVDAALRQCAKWRREGLQINVAVNLPGNGLLDGDVVANFASQLSRHELPPSALEVEITEGSLVTDPAAARDTILRLRELGVYPAIDDFGVGYSSLAYLRTLPVRALKIDKSFLTGGLTDPRDENIVRSAISLAHNLSLDVVAEGVEDEATLARLRACGCDAVQGYFIGRPMPAVELRPWFDAGPWTSHPMGT